MRIINIVERLDQVNFGVWNAALNTAPLMNQQFGATSEVWYGVEEVNTEFLYKEYVEKRFLRRTNHEEIYRLIEQENFSEETIIVTHGAWRFPTHWGAALRKAGVPWVYVPHGMLNKWSRNQHWWKKLPYFFMVERSLIRHADGIRAVGKVEHQELRSRELLLDDNQIFTVNNGIAVRSFKVDKKSKPLHFLFMARLHHKKGILPLVRAWIESTLSNRPEEYRLSIAGPDDGELKHLHKIVSKSTNIDLLGPVYGADKESLLKSAHYFLLPSHNEGFPTAVLEAVNFDLIPLISWGCNFPELLEQQLALLAEPDARSIHHALEKAKTLTEKERQKMTTSAKELLSKEYDLLIIAKGLFDCYNELIEINKKSRSTEFS